MIEREGQRLGNYWLVEPLGQGGFAEVYLGEHIHLGTKVAIKLLRKRVARDEAAVFLKEARTLTNLDHPNIVHVLDFGIETNTSYLVMDYAPGGSLRKRHPKDTLVPPDMVVVYVKQIAKALQYAHDKQVIHCDVKPGNILLGGNGELLLSDFGIAKQSQAGSTSEHPLYYPVGTPYYMAPEQIHGKPEKASDQYALAIMVYEWLCGKPPFSEGNVSDIQRQHLDQPVPPLREQPSILSPAIEEVVLQALSKQPEERFNSVQAFASALESAITIKPPPKQSETVTPTSSRIPRRTVLFGTGGAVGLALLGTIWWEIRTASLPPRGTLYLTYRRHTRGVLAVAWSPDGKRIASASDDQTVQVWDAATGGNVFTYRGHTSGVFAVAWSPDGKRIASASGDGTVQVWDAATGGNVFTYMSAGALAWSPDDTRIASASEDRTVQVWNAATGDNVFTYSEPSDRVEASGSAGTETVAWSPDGQRIACAINDESVQVWNAANGSNIFTYRGHSNVVFAVAWSPDSQRIASASADRSVQVWDAANGGNSFIQQGYAANYVDAVAWSPDGTHIASGGLDRTAQVWDAANGSHIFIYRKHSDFVHAVAWSPDSQRIASASDDGTVQVWQAV